jgi:uncharacterized protein YegP (UPF0339 family)
MQANYEIQRVSTGGFRFVLRSPDGEILAGREGFASRDETRRNIESMQSVAAAAVVADLPTVSKD